MGLGETKCPAIVAPENRHALPSRLLLTGRRPVCSRRLRRRSHGMRDLWSRTIRMVRGTDSPALTLTPNGVRSSTGRRKRLPSSRSFRLLTDRRPVRMVCETFGLALLATTSRSVIDRPHSRSAGLLTDRFALRLLTGLRPVRACSRDLRSRAIHFRGAPYVFARRCRANGLRDQRSRAAAPRRQRAPPHASWPVRSDTLLPDTDRSGE